MSAAGGAGVETPLGVTAGGASGKWDERSDARDGSGDGVEKTKKERNSIASSPKLIEERD